MTSTVTASELDTLRAYVPTETLLKIQEISNAESAEYDKSKREYEAVSREFAEIKERMKRDRQRLKELERKRKAHFARPLFARADAARDAAIKAAKIARDAAIAAGETPKIETQAECTKRVMEGGK